MCWWRRWCWTDSGITIWMWKREPFGIIVNLTVFYSIPQSGSETCGRYLARSSAAGPVCLAWRRQPAPALQHLPPHLPSFCAFADDSSDIIDIIARPEPLLYSIHKLIFGDWQTLRHLPTQPPLTYYYSHRLFYWTTVQDDYSPLLCWWFQLWVTDAIACVVASPPGSLLFDVLTVMITVVKVGPQLLLPISMQALAGHYCCYYHTVVGFGLRHSCCCDLFCWWIPVTTRAFLFSRYFVLIAILLFGWGATLLQWTVWTMTDCYSGEQFILTLLCVWVYGDSTYASPAYHCCIQRGVFYYSDRKWLIAIGCSDSHSMTWLTYLYWQRSFACTATPSSQLQNRPFWNCYYEKWPTNPAVLLLYSLQWDYYSELYLSDWLLFPILLFLLFYLSGMTVINSSPWPDNSVLNEDHPIVAVVGQDDTVPCCSLAALVTFPLHTVWTIVWWGKFMPAPSYLPAYIHARLLLACGILIFPWPVPREEEKVGPDWWAITTGGDYPWWYSLLNTIYYSVCVGRMNGLQWTTVGILRCVLLLYNCSEDGCSYSPDQWAGQTMAGVTTIRWDVVDCDSMTYYY